MDNEQWDINTENGYLQLSEKYHNAFYNSDNGCGKIGFQDTLDSYGVMVKNNSEVLWVHDEYSIAHPEEYPMSFRIWTRPIEKNSPAFLGMIDDDLLYDFREEDPFRRILTHNQNGVFIYVYDLDVYRRRSADWHLHDRILYGIADGFREDRRNRSRITYGPIITDPNHPVLRALRSYIFQRMYLAKLRLARLIHPAPRWLEDAGDYVQIPVEHRPVDQMMKMYLREIEPQINVKWNRDEKSFIEQILKASHEEYFSLLFHRLITPVHALRAFDNGDMKEARYWARVLRYQEIYRDLYLHKMYVRTGRSCEQDFERYWNKKYLSVALWSGSNGAGRNRHRFNPGLKSLFPYFDVADKRGHPGLMKGIPRGAYRGNHTGGFTNTAGLIYAGHLSKRELDECNRDYQERYHQKGDFYRRIWEDAIAGPVMIVSRRTYRRYGHEYFEKLAEKKLKMIDVTGALIESSARTLLTPDPDIIEQLMDMDYFYYKANDDELLGNRRMKPAFAIRLTEISVAEGNPYNPVTLARNPVSVEVKDNAGSFHREVYPFGEMNKYREIILEIRNALKKDEEEFPGLSLRMGNYYPVENSEPMEFPRKYQKGENIFRRGISGSWWKGSFQYVMKTLGNKPRTPRSIEFLAVVQEMKKRDLVEKLKKKYTTVKTFQAALVMELRREIPWLLFNPNLFLVYYKHIDMLMPLYREFTGYYGKELYNGISDGTVIFTTRSRLQPSAADAIALAIKMRCIWKHDTSLRMLLNYCIALSECRYDFRGDLAAYGRLRKMLWHHENDGSPFPRWESELTTMTGSPFESSYYHHTYRWMRNNSGEPLYLREPTAALMQGKQNGQARALLLSQLFPGMFRYLDRRLLANDLSFYAEYHWKRKYLEHTHHPDVQQYVMFHPYEPRLMTISLLRFRAHKDNLPASHYTKMMKMEMRAHKSILPTENHTFVITDGIQTTVTRMKKAEACCVENMKLYEGLKEIAGKIRPPMGK